MFCRYFLSCYLSVTHLSFCRAFYQRFIVIVRIPPARPLLQENTNIIYPLPLSTHSNFMCFTRPINITIMKVQVNALIQKTYNGIKWLSFCFLTNMWYSFWVYVVLAPPLRLIILSYAILQFYNTAKQNVWQPSKSLFFLKLFTRDQDFIRWD